MDPLSIRRAVSSLQRNFPTVVKDLVSAFENEDVNQISLCHIARLLLDERYTLKVAELFSPLLLDLLLRCRDFGSESLDRHEELCIVLGKLIWMYPNVSGFTYDHFSNHAKSMFARYENVPKGNEEDSKEGPPSKKIRVEKENEKHLTALLISALQFLAYDVEYFKKIWDWSVIVSLLENEEELAWLTHQCLAKVGGISLDQLKTVMEDNYTEATNYNFYAKYGDLRAHLSSHNLLNQRRMEVGPKRGNRLKAGDITLTEKVAAVEGVLVPVQLNSSNVQNGETIVLVESVQKLVQQISMAVASRTPVLLQGPLGCGKTSLVEHLAELTNRKNPQHLLKIQLCDQVDSKLLLGSYCCTEVPGEFVWQPGILTQAVVGGHWLILEDIDSAPMDVLSILDSIVESKTLVLPGHANPIRAHSSFQLFATQRLLPGHQGSYSESGSNAPHFNKSWRKIMIRDLNFLELKDIICKKWPALQSFAENILMIYRDFLPTSSHVISGDIKNNSVFPESLQHGRFISVRDLFKFCRRIAKGFTLSQGKEGTYDILKHAVDCFCNSFASSEDRLKRIKLTAEKFSLSAADIQLCMSSKIDIDKTDGRIGRAKLSIGDQDSLHKHHKHSGVPFAHTNQATRLLEKIAVAVSEREPILLVGPTGTGKTSVVQYLADITNHKLCVINMSQQSDSADLLGGFKPVDLKTVLPPLRDEFDIIFPKTFCQEGNRKFCGHIQKAYINNQYEVLFMLMRHVSKAALERYSQPFEYGPLTLQVIKQWTNLDWKFKKLQHQIEQYSNPLAFTFIEGALIQAIRAGDWILLDEINLAEAETLQCLSGLLEGSLMLLEKGETDPVHPHSDFRIFACMNPATDVGKKDLTVGIRNRFTEFYVDEIIDHNELATVVESYLKNLRLEPPVIHSIVKFYIYVKKEAVKTLNDGMGYSPHYSLRTLCRALSYASTNPCGIVLRSLYEGFALSFLSQLDQASYETLEKDIQKYILGEKGLSILKQKIREPKDRTCVLIEGYYISAGDRTPHCKDNYLITKSVQNNLQRLARSVSAGKYPVLIQGETSVGKTSLIQWLADATGNYCVRINNHEHTDIQEYIGSYAVNEDGKLFFKEGLLVTAMRKGYWIILDELNLAPTEVMEALNRVLDDNRELFITETQTTVKAHDKFMVFATQNPPGQYGGRKVLSRAFRNRFIELYFDELPSKDLENILEKRCSVSPSMSKKMVAVMQDLKLRRRETGIFAGKEGFITLRDLFRWGDRYAAFKGDLQCLDQTLAEMGYKILASRVRREEEVAVVVTAIEKNMRAKIDPSILRVVPKPFWEKLNEKVVNFKHVVFTKQMRRLLLLIEEALVAKEPVLLVGDTGCGKTTLCQLFAELNGRKLYSVNCHSNNESAEFLGSLRPVRSDKKSRRLFEWVDGPLIQAMKEGQYFLADEMSLADDAVLERLNSLLEPERTIQLTEHGDDGEARIVAHEDFRFFATMNPSGDYGKKELSPALRNRLTEIWCPSNLIIEELNEIVEHNIEMKTSTSHRSTKGFGFLISEFMRFYLSTDISKLVAISVRDVLTWVNFINVTVSELLPLKRRLSPEEAYIHGACLVFLDSLGTSSTSVLSAKKILEIKELSFQCLLDCLAEVYDLKMDGTLECLRRGIETQWVEDKIVMEKCNGTTFFGIGSFCIKAAPDCDCKIVSGYTLDTPTVKTNALRILRAMQLRKPILLEGSPGVGKTSLVTTLAKITGHKVVRVNLSEQTDITDLFGTDLPVENGECGQFAWRDGPFLQAMKNGHWILLDELNLASQSVLEGLNACLDHRGEIYIPELNKSFTVETKSKIFGCQNPHKQGGSRKGLPRSFLNRFTQVYMESLNSTDLQIITLSVYPNIPKSVVLDMVSFNERVNNAIKESNLHGCTYLQFNLRDLFRWCELMTHDQQVRFHPIDYVRLLYVDRIQSPKQKEEVYKCIECIFGKEPVKFLQLNVFLRHIQLGYSFVPRIGNSFMRAEQLLLFQHQLPVLESLMKCIEMNWMSILVGPPASGKTSIVRFLASLTGNPLQVLSMNSEIDTTELLGGFEQANLNRHVDFIMQDLEYIVRNAFHFCIKGANEHSYEQLTQILSAMYTLNQIPLPGPCPSLADEMKFFKSRIKCLKEIFIPLDSINLEEDVRRVFDAIKEKLTVTTQKFEITSGATSGGRFEWVNSILVEAVRKGHWLLVENANFCSPSVLDRLNGLLEQDGTLFISEQGVTGDDILEIKPHPNFRIILTMDPQNGEISPAMRNRGVEIVFTAELMEFRNNQCTLSDLFSFFHNFHITDYHMVTTIRNVYNALSETEGIGKLSTYDLTNVTSLIVEHLHKSRDKRQAIAAGFTDGFINGIANEKSYMIAHKQLQMMLNEDSGYHANPLPHQSYLGHIYSSVEWQVSSIYVSAKQECKMFEALLMQFMNSALRSEEKDYYAPIRCKLPPPSEALEWVETFTSALQLTFQRCSPLQWQIILIWLKETFGSCLSDLRHFQNEGVGVIRMLQRLVEIHFTKLYEPKLLKDHVLFLKEIVDGNLDIDVRELPFDIRINRYVHQKLRALSTKKQEKRITSTKIEMLNVSSDKVLFLSKLDSFYICQREIVEIQSSNSYKGQISLWGQAQKLSKHPNVVSEAAKPFLQQLAKFISECYVWLRKLILELPLLYDDGAHFDMAQHILELYLEFLQFCRNPISLIAFDKFPLYWMLFMKKFLKYLNMVGDIKCTFDLNAAVEFLNRHTDYKTLSIRNIRSKLGDHWMFPWPLADEQSVKAYLDIGTITEALGICQLIRSPTSLTDLQAVFSNGLKWIEQLCILVEKIVTREACKDQLFHLQDIKLQLHDVGLLKEMNGSTDDDDDVMAVCQQPVLVEKIEPSKLKSIIQLLPMQDCFFVFTEAEVLSLVAKQLHDVCLLKEMNDSIDDDDDVMAVAAVNNCESLLDHLNKSEVTKLFLDVFHLTELNRLCSQSNKTKKRFELKQPTKLFQPFQPYKSRSQLQENFSECLLYFLRHLQTGPSTDHRTFLNWGENVPSNVLSRDRNKVLFSPIVTSTCFNLLPGSGNSLTGGLNLKNFSLKQEQLNDILRFLWEGHRQLVQKDHQLKKTVCEILSYWYLTLLSALRDVSEIDHTQPMSPSDIMKACEILNLNSVLNVTEFPKVLLECFEELENFKLSLGKKQEDIPSAESSFGKVVARVGLTSMLLLAPLDPYDPVVKQAVKMTLVRSTCHRLKMEYNFMSYQCKFISGYPIDSVQGVFHPHVPDLKQRIDCLKKKEKREISKSGYRPEDSEFQKLKNQVHNFFAQVVRPPEMYKKIEYLDQLRIQILNRDISWSSMSATLDAIRIDINSCKHFAQKIYKEYSLFKDLTHPFLTGLEMLILGLEASHYYFSSVDLQVEFDLQFDMKKFFAIMGSFPYLDDNVVQTPLKVADYLTQDKIFMTCKKLIKNEKIYETSMVSLLKSCLLEVINEAVIFGKNPDILNTVMPIFTSFYKLWTKQEEELKAKKETSECMYEHKPQTYGDVPLDEVAKQEIKKMFPSYHQNFQEFITNYTDETEEEQVPPAPPTGSATMSADDMLFIWRYHMRLISTLMPNCKLDIPQQNTLLQATDEPDYISAYGLRYDILKTCVQNRTGKFNEYIDTHLVGGHMIVANTAFWRDSSNSTNNATNLKSYNIYHDPNPSEVLATRDHLEKLASRINVLLEEFPQDPRLTTLLLIVKRIQSFSISDPLLKFMTGLELLLSSAQDWERNARKRDSLKIELEAIAQITTRYRKLELSCWNQCLDSVITKQYVESAKLWSHLYATLLLNSEKEKSLDVINTLQVFMENATLGEFEARLLLLQTFSQHLTLTPSTSQKTNLNILFNIHSYYSQFLTAIQDKIESVRKPIEKGLKDFVKISKWNAADFYSMRGTIEKSHETIHRSMKKFESELSRPSKLEFQMSTTPPESTAWYLHSDVKNYFPPLDVHTPRIALDDVESYGAEIFKDLPRYCRKSTKICKRIYNVFPVFDKIITLDAFTGNVVEDMQELEAQEIRKKRDEGSQKREIRRVLDSKRKRIATLFHNLTLIGLSYRKGQIFTEKLSKSENGEWFLVPMLEDKQWIDPESNSPNILFSAWCDSNYYYYKCIGQFFLLKKDAQSPSKDLGDMSIVQKCMGFSGHLFKMVISQRETLSSLAKSVQDLSLKSSIMLKLHSNVNAQEELNLDEPSEMYFPPQKLVGIWKVKLCSYLVQTLIAFQQLEILLKCRPVDNAKHFPMSESSLLCSLSKDYKQHDTAMHTICFYIKKMNSIISSMIQMSEKKVIDTWDDLRIIKNCFSELVTLLSDLDTLENAVINRNGEMEFITYIIKLREEIFSEQRCFTKDISSDGYFCPEPRLTLQEKKLSRLSEHLLTSVLKSIENIFMFLITESHLEPSTEEETLSKLVNVKISCTLEKVNKLLDIPNILNATNGIIVSIRCCKNSTKDISIIRKFVINVMPVLKRYSEMAKLILVGHIGMHRTSCKLLSELLRVFNGLVVKGFSIPPEFQELAEKSGATQFQDIEQGGLGQGEGTKDVSDTITSEDQLEETMGNEDQKNEKSDMKDEEHGIEMSEDFEGQIYDPEVEEQSGDEDKEEDIDDTKLDKQMGDVGQSEAADKLNEQVWGSDDDDEEDDKDMEEDESGQGVTSMEDSELAPKDAKAKMDENKKNKSRQPTPEEKIPDSEMNDEYTGEFDNTTANQAPNKEPDIFDLENDLRIDEDGNEDEEMDSNSINDGSEIESSGDVESGSEANEDVADMEDPDEAECENGEKGMETEVLDDFDPDYEAENEDEDGFAPSQQTASNANSGIMPSEMTPHASRDMVKRTDEAEGGEDGAEDMGDQHDGEASAENSTASKAGHEGKRSTLLKKMAERSDHNQARDQASKRKQPHDARTVANQLPSSMKRVKLRDCRDAKESGGAKDADEYEHVVGEDDDDVLAIDSATHEQASKHPFPYEDNEDMDVVPVCSEEDDDGDGSPLEPLHVENDVSYRKKSGRNKMPGESDYPCEDLQDDDDDSSRVMTQGAQRPPTSIFNTRHDLWSALSLPHIQQLRAAIVEPLNNLNPQQPGSSAISDELWPELERIVSPLVQELCEQLRLILEPTKTSKFKGDYRTGKRLNMRKVITYIASQFQKDKIWLRRTKPSKREYQIMLALDDSSSMADNEAQELAFESLVLLGKSLSVLDVGELAVVSFGENVQLLHDFGDTFSPVAASKIIQSFSFAQNATKFAQLVNYVNNKMVSAHRMKSRLISKEVAQLLIIISDGRMTENKQTLHNALRRARSNNIFIVYIIADNPKAKYSICDAKTVEFGPSNSVITKSYMEDFPFPFYIVLRNIASFPAVLGEAMRQWFELVTSADR